MEDISKHIEPFITQKGKPNSNLIRACRSNQSHKLSDSYIQVLEHYKWCATFGETIYCYLNNITKQPLCGCGTALKYSDKGRYFKSCSKKCEYYFRIKTESIKQTCLEKYGVSSTSNLDSVKEKTQRTWQQSWKEGHPSRNSLIKNKIKQTCLEKYGVDNAAKSELVEEKRAKTCLERYGAEYPSQLEEFKSKAIDTNISRYGVKNYSLTDEFRNKTASTNNKKYGVDSINYINIDLICFFSSSYEQEISDFLLSLNPNLEIQRNSRSVIPPFELDIYLPDHKLAIEFNGDFYHTQSLYKDFPKNKHKDKFLACEKQEIQLLQIRESDWINKKEVWKSVIKSKLGFFDKKVFARKCEIKAVSYSEAKKFLEQNHLQGSTTSKLNYGLYFEDELVIIQTYKKIKEEEYELNRMASKPNYQIIGGASKLFKHFLKENNPTKVVTFADLEYSVGKIYEVLGFKLGYNTKPSYYYFKDGKYYHKRGFQKKNNDIPDSITEQQYWLEKEYRIYWNCGNRKFVYIK